MQCYRRQWHRLALNFTSILIHTGVSGPQSFLGMKTFKSLSETRFQAPNTTTWLLVFRNPCHGCGSPRGKLFNLIWAGGNTEINQNHAADHILHPSSCKLFTKTLGWRCRGRTEGSSNIFFCRDTHTYPPFSRPGCPMGGGQMARPCGAGRVRRYSRPLATYFIIITWLFQLQDCLLTITATWFILAGFDARNSTMQLHGMGCSYNTYGWQLSSRPHINSDTPDVFATTLGTQDPSLA